MIYNIFVIGFSLWLFIVVILLAVFAFNVYQMVKSEKRVKSLIERITENSTLAKDEKKEKHH